MKIVIINGSARKGNTLTAINAFIKGASEKNEIEIIEPDKLNIAPYGDTMEAITPIWMLVVMIIITVIVAFLAERMVEKCMKKSACLMEA